MAIFSACSVVGAVPDTFTLSPSTAILTPDAARPMFLELLVQARRPTPRFGFAAAEYLLAGVS